MDGEGQNHQEVAQDPQEQSNTSQEKIRHHPRTRIQVNPKVKPDTDLLAQQIRAGSQEDQKKRLKILEKLEEEEKRSQKNVESKSDEKSEVPLEPDASMTSEEIDHEIVNAVVSAGLFDRCVEQIKLQKDPQKIAGLVAAAVGIISMFTNRPELAYLALYGGFSTAAAAKFEGVGGKTKAIGGGVLAALAISKGLPHVLPHLPGPEVIKTAVDKSIPFTDDVPNMVKVGSLITTQASQVASRMRK